MKTLLNKQLSLIVLIFISFNFFIVEAQMLKVEMEEISVNSHLIIKGIVSKKWSEYDTNGKDIITIVEFNVIETIKGTSSEKQRVVVPGGIIGDVGMMVSHTPQFDLGEESIVFITNDYKGRQTVTEWIQGNFEIINNKIFYEGDEIIMLHYFKLFSLISVDTFLSTLSVLGNLCSVDIVLGEIDR